MITCTPLPQLKRYIFCSYNQFIGQFRKYIINYDKEILALTSGVNPKLLASPKLLRNVGNPGHLLDHSHNHTLITTIITWFGELVQT